jgi:hypothetical protein
MSVRESVDVMSDVEFGGWRDRRNDLELLAPIKLFCRVDHSVVAGQSLSEEGFTHAGT